MRLLRWSWRLFRSVFTWEVCGTICCYMVVILLVALFVDNTTSRYAAQNSLATARGLSHATITHLNDEIAHLSQQLAHTSAVSAKQRGELLAKIEALSSQLEQLGATPVVIPGPTRTLQPAPAPTVTRTASPRPGHTPTHGPTPTPSPSPSCNLDHLLRCL